MAQMGWVAAGFPEAYGGAGTGWLELALIVEALGQGAIPSPLFSTVVEAGFTLLDAGADRQKEEWLPRIAAGEALMTVALMEANGGLRAQDIRTRIAPIRQRLSDRWHEGVRARRRRGRCHHLVARSGDGAQDLTLAVVPKDAPGVKPAPHGGGGWRSLVGG